MCQVHGPSATVACEKCGAGFYEGSAHYCKKFVPYEAWRDKLRSDAEKTCWSTSSLVIAAHKATQRVARWPEWKLRAAWAEEFRHSIGEATDEG